MSSSRSSAGAGGSGSGGAKDAVAPPSARVQEIMEGFKIHAMNMRDADTGRIVWESNDWADAFSRELEIRIPKHILQLHTVSREMTFSSRSSLSRLHLVQTILFHHAPIETWRFAFGFVIPNSTNTWQCCITAAESGVLPAEHLSGNVVIETVFMDGDEWLATARMRVFYV